MYPKMLLLLLFLLLIVLVLGLCIGLIKPQKGLFWKNPEQQTRKEVIKFYSIAIFIFILFAVYSIFFTISTFKGFMQMLCIGLLFLTLLGGLFGLLFPKWAVFWKDESERTRQKVSAYYGGAFVILTVLGFFIGKMPGDTVSAYQKELRKESETALAKQEEKSIEEKKKQQEELQQEKKEKLKREEENKKSALEEEKKKKEAAEKKKNEEKQKVLEEKKKREEELATVEKLRKEEEKKEKEKKEQKEKERKVTPVKTKNGYDFEKEKKEILDTIQKQKESIKLEKMAKHDHWFSGPSFETSDDDTFLYFGKIKDGKPHGIGALYKEGNESYDLYYAGHFNKGFFDDFGLRFKRTEESYALKQFIPNGINLPSYLAYEGYFKDGKYEGKGNEHDPILFIDVISTSLGEELPERSYRYLEKNDEMLSAWGEKEHTGVVFTEEKTVPMDTFVSRTGIFKGDKLNGKGKNYRDETTLTYEGDFNNDEYHGKGTSYLNGKKEYEGSYSKGKYDGKGTLYDKDGKVVHSGKFADGVWKGSN